MGDRPARILAAASFSNSNGWRPKKCPGFVCAAERGATIVEAAIILPIFFTLVLVGIDLLRLSFHWLSVQYLVERGIRRAVIAGTSGGDVRDFVIARGAELGLSLAPGNIGLCPAPSTTPPSCLGTADAGQSTEMLSLEVQSPIEGFIVGAGGVFHRRPFILSARAMAQRENPA